MAPPSHSLVYFPYDLIGSSMYILFLKTKKLNGTSRYMTHSLDFHDLEIQYSEENKTNFKNFYIYIFKMNIKYTSNTVMMWTSKSFFIDKFLRGKLGIRIKKTGKLGSSSLVWIDGSCLSRLLRLYNILCMVSMGKWDKVWWIIPQNWMVLAISYDTQNETHYIPSASQRCTQYPWDW